MRQKLFIAAIAVSASAVTQANQPSFTTSPAVADVHNRCIVRFHDSFSGADAVGTAKRLAARARAAGHANAAAQYVYRHTIKGATLNLSCTAASAVFGGDSSILRMTPDSVVRVSAQPDSDDIGTAGQVTPWGIARVGGSVDGSGRDAWIIDTGIDLDHADLNVDGSRGFTAFTRGPSKDKIDDDHGHGTHVAGTVGAIDNGIDVVGVAANATVIPVKVLDKRGSGTTSGVIAGIDYVGANAAPGDCANMSLGGGVSQDLDDAVVAASENSGAYFVLAAGNDGDDANNHSPARANGTYVRTISAHDDADTMPSWSNWGNPPVDYAAPGVDVLSTAMGGGTTTYSGTSMASPHACAVMMMTNGNPNTDGTVSGDPDGDPDSIIHL
ncbi:S8 family serine peptidase [Microbulbifer halophilus]|uniref:S8 family serine peptidase n=1 Tax=Microbulbifer halophilus TaxID=453963 RepID=A0ABW5E686_9GAMM|nr:S8 family serine peptidase [Microbulbifer halophilus]MCW8126059.1 S8 family serine peptidase [Microbulbifer halophilus]